MNNSNANTETETDTAISRFRTSEDGVDAASLNSSVVHSIRTQYAPLVQQSLDSTSITIEENTTHQQGNLVFTNETSSTGNIMEQYARFLREQVAGVTRSGLSNFIAVTRNSDLSHQNASELVTQSGNSNRIRSLPASLGNLNSVLTTEGLRAFSRVDNFVSSADPHEESLNNQMLTLSGREPEIVTNAIPNRTYPARTPILVADQHLHLSSNFRNNVTSSNVGSILTPNQLNQPITSRDRLNDGRDNLTDHRTTSTTGTNPPTENSTRATEESATSTNELYNNIYPDIVITTIRICLHYIPFACILFVKFIYDHLLGILDLITLQFVMYCVNKSLQAQVVKLEQKKNSILLRDLFLVVSVVSLRLSLASAPSDPFGLLIAPSSDETNIIHQIVLNIPQSTKTVSQNQLTTTAQSPIETTVVIPKLISAEVILYYIAVNDLVLKLITISIKLLVTLLPLRAIRHKSRTRLYVFIEFFSQFYRSLVPIQHWLLFLFASYSGLHAISGVLFSSTYIVLKGCELADRGKSLKKSCMNLMDKSRKPARDNFDTNDEICAICQDTYVSPVVLECGHIFCDNCVTIWFKREQTCPMCRAKVGDNFAWHDGSTTFFYQLY
ncbi:E3 ubiquitin-protein ligase RNFT1 [Anastrepha obliqua]|uniref:E3 ubiquitin-protein ligase RNFT1 n=1 Tax=Anastrepha obliqua TaxID=95512 RepID=UPI0024099108|nr:E3 ubiquitin-protein ligase RNFT1 [Anastrepha obliqua]